MVICQQCNKEILNVVDVFTCKYCNLTHCPGHRLPEDHGCPNPSNPHK